MLCKMLNRIRKEPTCCNSQQPGYVQAVDELAPINSLYLPVNRRQLLHYLVGMSHHCIVVESCRRCISVLIDVG
jgi:hypothetical protein